MSSMFKYELTEEEKRAVRTMLSARLAKHGVTCSVSTEELLEGLGVGPEGLPRLPILMPLIATRTVTETRNGVPESFPLFKVVQQDEVLCGQPSWRFCFTRKFLQFCVGRRI